MLMLDRDIHLARALVIDANATSRSVMAAQLRDLGIQQVRQIARVQEARVVLEEAPHDIVLCEMSFGPAAMSGQDLIDELRREELLPYSTIFILVTGEATYAQVIEAAESTVDGYLVKPYSGSLLADRLQQARRRKRTLKAIYENIQRRDYAAAAAIAEKRFDAHEPYWLFAGQVAAELWLRADAPPRAMRIYARVLDEQPQAWARVGMARARLAGGEIGAARRLLEAMVAQSPDHADARDLLGRVLVEQGEFAAALDEFRACAELTPGCLLRLQHHGMLAFHRGDKDDAARVLERTVASGRKSKLFDPLSLLLLGLLKFDARDGRGVAAVLEQLQAGAAGSPSQPPRLDRMRQVAGALVHLLARRTGDALEAARRLAAGVLAPDGDLEAATLAIALWARIPRDDRPAGEFEALLRDTGLRFCVSKACTEVLVASADGDEQSGEALRGCHTVVTGIAEQALNRSLAGEAAAAVEMLLEQGERTRNAKLIEMAGAVARRHVETVPGIETVLQRVKALQADYCKPLTHLAGVSRSARAPGGVVLRT